ncbi:MAG: AAA family ATPase, partial [Clostridia bacterium]|nr:AAA family ATPase [Clostridia bacterium]
MGTYFNPGNDNFRHYIFDDIYVDKTGLITVTNSCVFKSRKYICVTRPRRFGKSYAADMLTAYYSRGCDSHALFDGLVISKSRDYETYINKFNVIHVDVSGWIKMYSQETVKYMVDKLYSNLISEIHDEYPSIPVPDVRELPIYLDKVYKMSGIPFVFVI